MAIANSVQNALIKFTGLDKVLQKELAARAQLGGMPISTHALGDTDIADTALIEESLSQFNIMTRMHRDRKMRYVDYDSMDNYGDISVALDIYSEEATQMDLVQGTNLWITSEDDTIVNILEGVIKRLRLRTLIGGMTREIAKFGDLFLLTRYSKIGVDKLFYVFPKHVSRVGAGMDQVRHFELDNIVSRLSPRKDGILMPWECVHFRNLMFGHSTLYGRAVLEPGRKRWLHLKLIEDAVSIYRLNRAVERIIFYIDVGNASPAEALKIVQKYKRKFGQKKTYLNPSEADGGFEQQYDPTSMDENIFYPVTAANERSRIEKLDPPPDQNQLQDLDHFNQKLFIALGIPKDYISGDVTGTWNSREALTLQDVRFSRKIHKLQLSLIEGLETLFRLHLAVLNADADAASQAPFKVNLADVSKAARQQYDGVLLNRVQLITSLDQMGRDMQLNREVWLKYILKAYFPDIPSSLLNTLIIPDKTLASAAQKSISSGRMESLREEVQNIITSKHLLEKDMLEVDQILESLDYADPFDEETKPNVPKKWLIEAEKIGKKLQ